MIYGNEVVTEIGAHSRQTSHNITLVQNYVVKETTGNNELNKDKIWT